MEKLYTKHPFGVNYFIQLDRFELIKSYLKLPSIGQGYQFFQFKWLFPLNFPEEQPRVAISYISCAFLRSNNPTTATVKSSLF